ncbi:protein of unknown function [Legionella pneumophila subsp. pneumophila]|uniref:Uncharacterized protein n=1 Tax=Legionella pneumophila subsp. pneumophila TaxID=91891 RepID=A0AAV2UZW5_LEGPN|nr:hypothetical protein LPE509_00563 [Legionella pneumophila subsp. pneumophila LPE509]CCD06646.1 protein of unknown function [Legionella pneumophila subsp. pneumophila]CCD09877.1 protein of unknown function [Legionella pneumophila subsp. pneumophila]
MIYSKPGIEWQDAILLHTLKIKQGVDVSNFLLNRLSEFNIATTILVCHMKVFDVCWV